MENSKKSRGVSRAEWLQAGLGALADGSIAEITIEGLARDLGISKSGFYWHFESRDALLEDLLAYWTHEITDVITESKEILGLDPRRRLQEAAEIILAQDLVRYEIAIRQWAKNDKRAARAIKAVNRKRLDFARQAFHDLGFAGDEAEMRAMLYVCYQTWESPMFPEISKKRRRDLIEGRIALLTTRVDVDRQSPP